MDTLKAIPLRVWGIICCSIALLSFFVGGNQGGSVGSFFVTIALGLGATGGLILVITSNSKKNGSRRRAIPIAIERQVRKRANDRCEFSGCNVKGSMSLEQHHINGDPGDSRVSNIILLCGNHHTDFTRGRYTQNQAREYVKASDRRERSRISSPAKARVNKPRKSKN